GASAGAVLWLLWLPALPLVFGAPLGVVAVLFLFFAGLGRQWQFSRNLILMGIAINAFAVALVQFALTLVQREQAQQMLGYLSGSL
uniref:iron chelate uptake ABC transporter family permease subunit n=1 Tax=Vibrio vulnificus TaxID=672 RepID=UPI0019D45A0B